MSDGNLSLTNHPQTSLDIVYSLWTPLEEAWLGGWWQLQCHLSQLPLGLFNIEKDFQRKDVCFSILKILSIVELCYVLTCLLIYIYIIFWWLLHFLALFFGDEISIVALDFVYQKTLLKRAPRLRWKYYLAFKLEYGVWGFSTKMVKVLVKSWNVIR